MTRKVFSSTFPDREKFTIYIFGEVMKRQILCVLATLFIVFQVEAAKVIQLGVTQEWDTVSAQMAKTYPAAVISSFLVRGLAATDKNEKPNAEVMVEIPSVKNKLVKMLPNGKAEVQFEIKPNVKWGDGVPVTCKDYEFARKVFSNDNVSAIDREYFTTKEKITWNEKNPKKCTVLLSKVKYRFNEIGLTPLPEHIEGPIFEQFKTEKMGWEKNSGYIKNPTQAGLYFGPFIVTEYKLGSHVIMRPNPFFYGAKPETEQVIVKFVPSSDSLEANLRSDAVNTLLPFMGFTLDQVLEFEKKVEKEKLPFQVTFKDLPDVERLMISLKNQTLSDLKVRKALYHAIDRELLTQSFFRGRQKVAHHVIPTFDPNYTGDPKNVSVYPRDIQKAQKLLDEVGWVMNPKDGYRYKNGEKLSFQFSTTAGNRIRETVQVFIADQWKKIGVDAQIKNYPARVLFGEIVRCGDHPGIVMAAAGSAIGDVRNDFYHSKHIPTKENSCSGLNSGYYSNPQVDAVLDQLSITVDLKKRKQLVAKFVKHYTEDLPELPLYYRTEGMVLPQALKQDSNLSVAAIGFENIENWKWLK